MALARGGPRAGAGAGAGAGARAGRARARRARARAVGALLGRGGSTLAGAPAPLGATALPDGGVNLAVATPSRGVSIVLWSEDALIGGRGNAKPSAEHELSPEEHRTGDVWHCRLTADMLKKGNYSYYGWRVTEPDGPRPPAAPPAPPGPPPVLVDPRAPGVGTAARPEFGDVASEAEGGLWPQMAGVLPVGAATVELPEFDWEGTRPPRHAREDLVVYEAHVRGLTALRQTEEGDAKAGTYAAVKDALPHLAFLGVNALELLPIYEFNEVEHYKLLDNGTTRLNFWGYSTLSFFAPMARYSSGDGALTALREMQEMVRECHRLGIEVILDVVFNHTAEGNEMGPSVTFRGLDERSYYVMAPAGEHYNYSGCGNTFNCNTPLARQFVLDCLRFWAIECRVDGFRFDLASILTRSSTRWDGESAYGSVVTGGHSGHGGDGDGRPAAAAEYGGGVYTGTPLGAPPLVEAISRDPALAHVKLFAEPWDAGGLYQVGSFPCGQRWAEWNGKFRDDVRRFLLLPGGGGAISDFAKRMCGSPDLYPGDRGPKASLNFVTCHDGFTTADLTAFNERHNMANGENNRDGEEHNLSWNCGEEGPTKNVEVRRMRARNRRNLMAALLLAHGTPMINMGDEINHTKGGNNNTYCWDTDVNYLPWDVLVSAGSRGNDARAMLRFTAGMVAFRKSKACLRGRNFPGHDQIEWHGDFAGQPDWEDTSELCAFRLFEEGGGDVYVAFNAGGVARTLELPHLGGGMRWDVVADTGAEAPFDFLRSDLLQDDFMNAGVPLVGARREAIAEFGHVRVLKHSCVVLEAVPHNSHELATDEPAYI